MRRSRTQWPLACATGAFLLVASAVASITFQYVRTPDAGDVLGSVVVIAAWLCLLWFCWRRGGPAWWRDRAAVATWLESRATTVVTVTGLAVFAVTLFTATVTLQTFPNSADEYVQLFQAATHLEGRLTNPAPPDDVADAFRATFMVIRDGNWLGRYPPGWPALLTVTGALGLPYWIVNPCLGLIALVLLWRICIELELPPAAGLACLLLATANGFFVFNAASYFAHPLVLVGALVFVLGCLRFQRVPSWQPAALAGVGLGIVGATRHLEAVVVAAPLMLSLLWFGPWNRRIKGAWILVGAAPFLVGLLWYHNAITGDPLLPPMVWSIPNDTLRFFAPDPDVHALDRAAVFAGGRIVTWSQWTSPPMLVAYLLAIAWLSHRRRLRFFDLYLPLLAIVYLFYWGYGGNQYGPRYYHVSLPLAALTIARAATLFAEQHDARWHWIGAVGLGLMLLVAQINFMVWSFKVHEVITERRDLYRLVEQHGLENALVIVADGTSPTYEMPPRDLIRNGIDLNGEVLFALDVVDEQVLRRRFPERAFWRYERPEDEPTGRLIDLRSATE